MNDGQLLALWRDGLSSWNLSTRSKWRVIRSFSRERKCGFKGAVLSAKDVLFSKFETRLEVKCEYESGEEYQLSDHQ